MTTREDQMRARLQEKFAPLFCEIENESAEHAGHAGAAGGGGHFRLRLVSAVFEGRNRITRHRLVYDCLRDMMDTDIHALTIIALAPAEISS